MLFLAVGNQQTEDRQWRCLKSLEVPYLDLHAAAVLWLPPAHSNFVIWVFAFVWCSECVRGEKTCNDLFHLLCSSYQQRDITFSDSFKVENWSDVGAQSHINGTWWLVRARWTFNSTLYWQPCKIVINILNGQVFFFNSWLDCCPSQQFNEWEGEFRILPYPLLFKRPIWIVNRQQLSKHH